MVNEMVHPEDATCRQQGFAPPAFALFAPCMAQNKFLLGKKMKSRKQVELAREYQLRTLKEPHSDTEAFVFGDFSVPVWEGGTVVRSTILHIL